MEAQARRLHPLVAGAAVAVILAAGVAVAAITGYLPGSKSLAALNGDLEGEFPQIGRASRINHSTACGGDNLL